LNFPTSHESIREGRKTHHCNNLSKVMSCGPTAENSISPTAHPSQALAP
jgi:hypothetical protein